jgi:hypothetical protein
LRLFMGSTRMALLLISTITMMYLLPQKKTGGELAYLVGEHGFVCYVHLGVHLMPLSCHVGGRYPMFPTVLP